MMAVGVNSATASVSKVVIVRQRAAKYARHVLDLEEGLLGSDDRPFYLMPLDLVYAPTRVGLP
jgi:hypothetical protein